MIRVTVFIFATLLAVGECSIIRVATLYQFPYQASLRRLGADRLAVAEHFCGGAIIGHHWVLTAAHCTSKPNVISAEDLIVVTGARHIRTGGFSHVTEQIINHEEYYEAAEPMRFDVALVKTKDPMKFNELVQPIKLRREWVRDGEMAVISGWKYENNLKISEYVRFYYVKTLNGNQCNNRIDSTELTLLSQNTLCATHGSAVSLGNSGGPLVTKDKKLVGIASWSAFNRNGRSDQFTRVSVFADWIQHHTHVVAI